MLLPLQYGLVKKSFEHIEEFSSHAAHELKTPLTIIKGELELALMGERSGEDYRRAMTAGLEEVETILQTIDQLLSESRSRFVFCSPPNDKYDRTLR